MKGDYVIISASPEDIVEIQKLDNYSFAGATLSISPCDLKVAAKVLEKKEKVRKDDVSPETAQIKEQFTAILASRYDVALKLLNLSDLANDAGLQKMGVFDGTTNTSKVFPALMAVCDGLFKSRKEKRDAIITVTLTDNNLTNVSEVTALAETFPDLKNIDLSRNNLVSQKSLESWQRKFRSLENLVLSGNPVESQLPTLKDEILKWYPNLRTINGVQLRTDEELARSLVIFSDPIPISGPDFRDVDQVGENFIRQFLPLYDNDRQTLLATFYDSQSIFTLSVNNSAPHSDQIIPAWAEYTKYSRNMVKITNLPTRMNRQFRGIQAISPIWSSLPKTQHPDIASQGNKYIVECHPVPGLPDPTGQSPRGVDGLIITIHGEFEEPPTAIVSKPVRSFSRNFILGPGGPGGPPIRVISDMLTVRAWGVLSSPHVTSPPVALQPITSTEQQTQERLAMQLTEKTGMTLQYSGMCLMESGWNLDQAFAIFTANKVFIRT
jgi:nuclear RNA export factor